MAISKFVRSHQFFRQNLLEYTGKQLQLSGETRWGTTVLCIQLVLDSKNGIDYVTTHEDIISMFNTVEKNILMLAIEDPMFYSLAKMICDALSPLFSGSRV